MNPSEVDLPLERCRRVEAVHAALPRATHYDVLEIPRDADKKAINKAYLERTLEFQSARYFAHRLGKYRAMMDAVFARVTEAYETLTSPYRRPAYDASLRSARLDANEPPRTQSGTRPAVRVAVGRTGTSK